MNVLVGITGGIAAYKSAYLVRLLIKNGHAVRVVMTPGSERFITPLTMMTLSGDRVYTQMFADEQKYDHAHIDLGQWADAFVIAPATANTIAKIAHGLADNLLTATVLAFPDDKQLFIAPAMNSRMFAKEATRVNLTTVAKHAIIVGPVQGLLACGEKGMGAMASPEEIFARLAGDDFEESEERGV